MGKFFRFSFEGQIKSLEKRRKKIRELRHHSKYYNHHELYMTGVLLDRMTTSQGLKSSRHKEESSRVTPTMRDSDIMVGRYEIQSWSFGGKGWENNREAVKSNKEVTWPTTRSSGLRQL